MKARLRAGLRRLVVSVPAEDGETMAALHREGEVLAQRSNGSQVEMEVRLPASFEGRLERRPGVRILTSN
jgi:hypothetical protein